VGVLDASSVLFQVYSFLRSISNGVAIQILELSRHLDQGQFGTSGHCEKTHLGRCLFLKFIREAF
jgi:hypothetical protein